MQYVTGNKYQNTFNDGNNILTSPAVLWSVCEVVKSTMLLNNICQTDDDKIKEFMLLWNLYFIIGIPESLSNFKLFKLLRIYFCNNLN